MKLLATLCVFSLIAFAAERLTYEVVTVDKLASGGVAMTRVEVNGYVTYVAHERDGDIHIRLCDQLDRRGMDKAHCVVAEIMPEIPLESPKVGWKITVRGITRFDGEHKFWEVHPVEQMWVLAKQ